MGTKILMAASDFQGQGRKHLKQVLGYRPIFSDDALDLVLAMGGTKNPRIKYAFEE